MKIPTEKELFKAGAHFGHKTSNWHPKMSAFIYGQKNNVHIINLEKTKQQLTRAAEFVKKITNQGGIVSSSQGGQILLVGTRVQSKEIIKKYAEQIKMPYVNERWLGGTLTNFKTIHKLVENLDQLEKQSETEDYGKKYTKKERHEFQIEMERLNNLIGGIRQMDKLPAAIFVASARYEKTVVNEALKKNIPTIAICDTNSNPEKITYPIPANDEAVKSIELITSLMAEAVKESHLSASALSKTDSVKK